mgnify:CR=1 FL=1
MSKTPAPADLDALDAEIGRLRHAATFTLHVLNNTNSGEASHATFCNGVHSESGQCEGEYNLSRAIDLLESALGLNPGDIQAEAP